MTRSCFEIFVMMIVLSLAERAIANIPDTEHEKEWTDEYSGRNDPVVEAEENEKAIELITKIAGTGFAGLGCAAASGFPSALSKEKAEASTRMKACWAEKRKKEGKQPAN